MDGAPTPTRVGITCALCHSTVDDAFAPGVGARRDGWPNRGLDVGAIVALWHPPQLRGPHFHDGRAPTLDAVVAHYDRLFGLGLSVRQRADLVEYPTTL